jgi:hypothetical protein
VSGDLCNRVGRFQRFDQTSERNILRLFKGVVVAAFQFNSDRKIIAAFTPLPIRLACMPCALEAGDKLQQAAIAADQEMG